MRNRQGSTWAKWDLHVHTPASLVQEYGGPTDAVWERFIADLERLPPDFKVLGINDYIFIDGYRRLRKEKENGRLANIDLLLPVIELRLAMFGGTKGPLSRINFHVIFSDQLDPEIIDQHFIRALPQHFVLSPDHQGLNWNALATRESIADLGRRIIESTPVEKRSDLAPPLALGFSNLNFEPASIRAVLQSHYLDRHLTAIGKTEWSEIKWSDNTIASKKTLINAADFVFTAAATPEAYERARAALLREGVNDRLLDCSDAHHFADSSLKDRIGNCFAWLKADTSFEGLQHIRREFDGRVFVGDMPDKLRLLRDVPAHFVKAVSIRRTEEPGEVEEWFNTDLELNPDLVAIIGNKGSGKSALSDAIGLLGNTPHSEHFSFLSTTRFRQNHGEKARLFVGTLSFHSGDERTRTLDAESDLFEPVTVNYVPQQYLEHVCTEVATHGDSAFDREIMQVIFSHVPDDERLGFDRLEEVLRFRTAEIERAIGQLRVRLHAINDEIVDAEDKGQPEHRSTLEKKLAARRVEIEQHQGRRPIEPPRPVETPENAAQRAEVERVQEEIRATTLRMNDAKAALDRTTRRRSLLRSAVERLTTALNSVETEKTELREVLRSFDLDVDAMLVAKLDTTAAEALIQSLASTKSDLGASLDAEQATSLPRQIRDLEARAKALQGELDEPQRRYHAYVTALTNWTARERELIGDANAMGSLTFLQDQMSRLEALPARLREMSQKRTEIAELIHAKLAEATETYRQLYGYAQNFIATHPVLKDKELLTFSATIGDVGFAEDFLVRIDNRTRGRFSGAAGERTLKEMLAEANFSDWHGTKAFLKQIGETLNADERHAQDSLRKQQKLVDFYDFIFSLDYLRPQYSMQLAGKPLGALSPGERGTLLLIFYLVVDRSDTPIVIDQPEDNLDNHTIYALLVPCIRDAKRRRQIIMVTHSPNIAVVCDAEQVICASYHAEGVRLRYTSGAIEAPDVNAEVLKILEGTRPAFDNRREKYQPYLR